MKKIILALLTLIMTISLFGCSLVYFADPAINSLPFYKSRSFYSHGDFRDYTDYAKYTYDSVTTQHLDASKYFKEITAEEVNEILLYIENFEDWVDEVGDEVKENYDFDKTTVSAGNYFYIKTKSKDSLFKDTYDKFYNYTLYYFDIDAQTLYYFHNKI